MKILILLIMLASPIYAEDTVIYKVIFGPEIPRKYEMIVSTMVSGKREINALDLLTVEQIVDYLEKRTGDSFYRITGDRSGDIPGIGSIGSQEDAG